MNKNLIVDASESDRRLMSGLLTRAGYEPIDVDTMEDETGISKIKCWLMSGWMKYFL